MAQNNYPFEKLHAYQISADEFIKFIDKVLNADEKELKHLGIKKSRFDIIKPGTLILQRIMQMFDIKNLITSGVGVREGVYLADFLRTSKDKLPTNYNTSVRYILDLHVESIAYANQLSKVVKSLFDLTHKYFNLDDKYRYELAIAAKLFTAGANMHYYSQHKHSYHLLQNTLEFGFTHQQTMLIATLSRYAGRKSPSALHVEKYKELLPSKDELNALNYLLSLSIALLSHRPRNIDFILEFKDNELHVKSKNNLYLFRNNLKKLDFSNKLNIKISS